MGLAAHWIVHTDPISDFCNLVISEAIIQGRAFKFGTVGAVNRLCFVIIAKFYFWWCYDALFSYAH